MWQNLGHCHKNTKKTDIMVTMKWQKGGKMQNKPIILDTTAEIITQTTE